MSDYSKPSLSRGEKKRRALWRAHKADPRCRVCLRETVIFSTTKKLPENAAVLAREFPKDDPRNDRPDGMPRKFLMCIRCADERASDAQSARPLEELWAASGRVGSLYYAKEPVGPSDEAGRS